MILRGSCPHHVYPSSWIAAQNTRLFPDWSSYCKYKVATPIRPLAPTYSLGMIPAMFLVSIMSACPAAASYACALSPRVAGMAPAVGMVYCVRILHHIATSICYMAHLSSKSSQRSTLLRTAVCFLLLSLRHVGLRA